MGKVVVHVMVVCESCGRVVVVHAVAHVVVHAVVHVVVCCVLDVRCVR